MKILEFKLTSVGLNRKYNPIATRITKMVVFKPMSDRYGVCKGAATVEDLCIEIRSMKISIINKTDFQSRKL